MGCAEPLKNLEAPILKLVVVRRRMILWQDLMIVTLAPKGFDIVLVISVKLQTDVQE